MTGQGLQGGFLKTHQVRHHQPAQHQVVALAKMGLERSEQTRYLHGQPAHPGHGWPRCWVVKLGFTHLSTYLQGLAGKPTSSRTPGLYSPEKTANHSATLIYL